MPRQMQERQTQTESEAPKTSEILDVNGFGGLYGRLLIASQVRESEVSTTINPDMSTMVHLSGIKVDSARNYNPITQKLSSEERVKAWEGIEFDEAYKKWREKLTASINTTTDEKRLEAIKTLTGLDPKEFKPENADTLYETFCKGKSSNTTDFAKTVVTNFQKDGKADLEKITDLSTHIKWFSANLFGKNTATTVSKIIEIEAEIANNPTSVVEEIFSDIDRVNHLTEKEKEILIWLHQGLSGVKKEAEEAHPAAAKITELKKTEKIAGTNTRLRAKPVSGESLIENHEDGKIYTVIGFNKNDSNRIIEVIVKDPDGNISTHPKKWLEEQINKEGTAWDIFEPGKSDALSSEPIPFVPPADDKDEINPAPLKLVDN